jgi:hypothetical protein
MGEVGVQRLRIDIDGMGVRGIIRWDVAHFYLGVILGVDAGGTQGQKYDSDQSEKITAIHRSPPAPINYWSQQNSCIPTPNSADYGCGPILVMPERANFIGLDQLTR